MIGKILRALQTIDFGPLLAMAAVSYGLGKLHAVTAERQEQLVELDAVIAARSARLREILAEIGQHMGAEEAKPQYPAPQDVAPLTAPLT